MKDPSGKVCKKRTHNAFEYNQIRGFRVLFIIGYCVLCTVYCILCTVYCVMYTAYCILFTSYCVLHTVYCILCTVYCTSGGKSKIVKTNQLENLGGFLWVEWRSMYFTFFKKDVVTRFNHVGFLKKTEDYRSIGGLDALQK